MDCTAAYDLANEKVFDYIIVGGGTAGLVLAARLTEDPSVQVVVLEAGEKRLDDPQINIPGLMTTLYSDSKYDWNFHTTPQPSLNNRTLHWPRGKLLGGTSAINFLMATHASRLDLDNWETLGNPGWNFDALQPYYRKSETFTSVSEVVAKELHTSVFEKGLHGDSGPLKTSFPKGMGSLDAAWPQAFKTLGLGAERDPREGEVLGGYNLLKYMDGDAKRSYAASAYYAPNEGRENLTVLTGAFVKKIEFEKVDGEGVVSARGSPQILELSGVGGRERLEGLGIEILVDNPDVGENLQDHPLIGFAYEALDGIPTKEMIKQPGVLEWAMEEYTSKGSGPLAGGLLEEAPTSTNPGLKKQLQLQTELLLNDKEADLQFNFGATGMNPHAGNDVSQFFEHSDAGGYAGITTVLTHAFSRGSIHIQSSDPTVHPIIDPCYLTHPLDIEILISGLLFTQTIASTSPLSSLLNDNNPGDGKRTQLSFSIPGRLTRETALGLVRNSSATSFHPVGTCSMLPRDDGGVVDCRLRVYGVRGLRVVDASVVPLNVRGNIASAVYAVAEKAADMIREDRAGLLVSGYVSVGRG
ncbi:hypothetical protein BKA65DRAFT_444215 [Rhexocercosporidium sp. MPI-PUGE-AT-0058]|nr:hypothetical protein BKA65DRAFT_444215 [Rhexocercosporidium sp. MPI-PUGE-AT-0058]